MTLFVWNRTSNKQNSHIKQQTKTKQMPVFTDRSIEVSQAQGGLQGLQTKWWGEVDDS
jgi:hypothetical protein